MVPGARRVARVDRGAVLLVPDGALHAPEVHVEPVRVGLDHDGLVPGPDGERTAPTVGDLVVVGERADGTAVVTALVRRRSALVRDSAGGTSRTQVMAANVDVVLVAEHLDPDPDLGRIERLLVLAWRSGARPVVVLTKADLVPDPSGLAAEVREVALGVDVHVVSAGCGEGLDPLRALLAPDVAIVLVGPSGAGKSTLVNALAGAPVMETGERRADGRGRHTTTHRELVPLGHGAMLIDTPGIRGVGVVADEDALDATFADVEALAKGCRFADCAHGREPGCAVRAALDDGSLPERRFDSWQRLGREMAFQARRADAALAAQDRARVKKQARAYRSRTRPPA
ncbi:ribosome small subunit-dependent GTPase A [Cellulomonas sp. P22]|uniref:ribosome small subunit-dependent GTPase A n=1 Tax=Cellulomonas sp. P22 TaxID=3373189 RepID=UPI00378793AC